MNPFWDRLVGHEKSVAQLRRLLENDQVPHALLFAGPDSVGKRAVALAFASSLLTDSGQDPRTAESLRLLNAGNHPDFRILSREEGKKDISVEATRGLCQETRLRPYYGRCSISFIDNAHEMNLAASNALLMTLEEPSPENYLILISHAPQRLPATILSRCQTIHFGELTPEQIGQLLDRLELDEKQKQTLSALCFGSLDSLELSAFVHPAALTIETSKALRTHLDDLVVRAARVEKEVKQFIRLCTEDRLDAGEALTLASHLTGEQDDIPLAWRMLHRAVRDALRAAPASELSRWSDLLALSLQAEKLCRERNTNPQLQMTNLLLSEYRP